MGSRQGAGRGCPEGRVLRPGAEVSVSQGAERRGGRRINLVLLLYQIVKPRFIQSKEEEFISIGAALDRCTRAHGIGQGRLK